MRASTTPFPLRRRRPRSDANAPGASASTGPVGPIAWLMTLVAASLVVASSIHLTGGHDDAGIPEAVIAVVLVGGVIALRRGARRLAVGAVVFAIAGFGIGIAETIRGGTAAEIAYHATTLPLLLLTLAQLVRSRVRAG